MSEFKGTKGEWGFVFGDNQYEVFSEPIYTGDFKDICSNIENEHDALLISKSPEMLEMLKYFIDNNMLSVVGEEMAVKLIKEATNL